MRGGDRRLWGTEGCRSPTESSQIGILAGAQLSKQTLNFFRLFFQWVSITGKAEKLPSSPSVPRRGSAVLQNTQHPAHPCVEARCGPKVLQYQGIKGNRTEGTGGAERWHCCQAEQFQCSATCQSHETAATCMGLEILAQIFEKCAWKTHQIVHHQRCACQVIGINHRG